MDQKIVSGIQQIGVGVADVHEAWKWYKKYFGLDIRMFEEEAVAELMLPYTGGQPRARYAVLALNMQGGGGFEIWQYTQRKPEAPKAEIKIGDIGIFAAKIKSRDIKVAYDYYKSEGLNIIGEMNKDPNGELHFYLKDPFNNIFHIVQGNQWFLKNDSITGACYGIVIGVSDVDKSKEYYKNLLGYDDVVYDKTGVFEDMKNLPGGDRKLRRVLIRHSKPRAGAFSPLFGTSEIELLQLLDCQPQKIFKDRLWGDLGFIHICFDIIGMNLLREECKNMGFPFTVDTGDTFDMGEAAGAFSYTEDPDGTLIEFVETHKIPIIKKIGWYLDLRKRKPEKSLPRWLLKAISFNRVKSI